MTDVFMSYSRTDREFAERLRTRLGEFKRTVWMDVEDIPATAKWRPEVLSAIESANAVIVVLSPDSVRSQECAKEIMHAVKHNKRTVPIVCREVDPKTVSPDLSELHWISFLPPKDFDLATDVLIKALDTDFDWLRAHTRLLVRALDWDTKQREPSLLLRGKDLNEAETQLDSRAAHTDPAPTSLQKEYVAASRRAAVTRRRVLCTSIGMSIVVVLSLAYGLFQAKKTAALEQEARLAADLKAKEQERAAELEAKLKAEAQKRADEQTKVAALQTELAAKAKDGERQAQETAQNQTVLAHVADSYQRLYREPLQAIDGALSALAIKKTKEAALALSTAQGVALKRKENRTNEAQLTGVGPGYLMQRWREGKMFSKLSSDGRYALVATERGKDGPNPPGQAFLLRLDGLATRELQPGNQAKGRRLEFLGFSSTGDDIFVSRQFYLDIYDLNGELKQSTQLEFHAKPVHLISGMFGTWVLVGDTVGHVMLADTASPTRVQLRGGSAEDAPVFIESSPDSTSAILVFESGRADLLTLSDVRSVRQLTLPAQGIVFAGFSRAGPARRFVTASREGTIDVWDSVAGTPRKTQSLVHGKSPARLAAFSADGSRIISLSDNDSIGLWDLRTGKALYSESH